MAVTLGSNTVTGLATLSVSTTTTLSGTATAPTAATTSNDTNIATTAFVDRTATRPEITSLTSTGGNSFMILQNGRLYECHGTPSSDNYTNGRNIVNQSYVTGVDRMSQVPIPETSPVTKFFNQSGWMCFALLQNGNLYAWGYNGQGNLGVGDSTNRYFPTLTATGVSDIYGHKSNNGYHPSDSKMLIKKTDGYIYTTGYNGYGQLGVDDTSTRYSWTQLTGMGTNPLFVGNFGNTYGATVIQKSDGTVWMAGYNGYGQLGNADTTGANPTFINVTTNWRPAAGYTISQMFGASGYVTTGAGSHTTLGLIFDNGTTNTAKVSGDASWGQAGWGDTTYRSTPYTYPTGTIGTGRINKIVWSADVVGNPYVLMANGNLYTCGYNGYGQQGIGDTTDRPTLTFTTSGVLDVYDSCEWNYGHYHTQFIKKADGLYGTGYNGYGELGVGDTTNRYSWTKTWLPEQAHAALKSCANFSTTGSTRCFVALTNNNTLWAWGYNGQYAIFPWNGVSNIASPVVWEMCRGD